MFFLNIYESYTYITIFLLFFVFINHRKIKIGLDSNSLFLLAFSVTYVLGNFDIIVFNRAFFALWIIICPYLLYRIGLHVGKLIDSDECLLDLILYLSVLFSFTTLLSIYIDIISNGFVSNSRDLHIILTRENKINSLRTATGISTMISPLLIYLPTLLLTRKGELLKVLLLGSLFSVLSIVGALKISTRTPFFLIAIISLIILLLNYRSLSFRGRFYVLVFIISISYFLYVFNFGEYNLTSALYSRIANSEDLTTFGSRSSRWIEGVQNIFKYPWGGDYMLNYRYYHNLWLDTYRVSGIIPMIFLLLFTLNAIGLIIKTGKNGTISLRGKTVIMTLLVVYLSVFFIEPIIEGAFTYFISFCFFYGLVYSFGNSRGSPE